MVDLAPEGSISLRDFYDRFVSWMWHGNFPLEQLDIESRIAGLPYERLGLHRAGLARVVDLSLAEAVKPFSSGLLKAFIVHPDAQVRGYLSSRAWQNAFFAERMMMADEIGANHGGEFDAAAGRTPFVDLKAVDELFVAGTNERGQTNPSRALRELLLGLVVEGRLPSSEADRFAKVWGLRPFVEAPAKDKHTPSREAVWTLPMVMAWIVWRDLDQVRDAMTEVRSNTWQWFGFRARVPINGGAGWHELDGEELKTLEPVSMFTMGLREILDRQRDAGAVVMSVRSAREDIWRVLTEGSIVAVGLTENAVVQIPAHEWPYIELEADRDGMDRLVYADTHKVAYRDVTLKRTEVLAQWPELAVPVGQDFDLEAPRWTLLAAALWVGCQGKALPSRRVVDEDLEHVGADELFAALARRLSATGLNAKRIREVIPAEYWELASTDPGQFRKWHHVSFIDDILEEEGGQLTPYGDEEPRWFGIRVEREDLFDAFPEYAPSPRGSPVLPTGRARRYRRKQDATRQALAELYPSGIPEVLTEKERLDAVNGWQESKGQSPISLSTLVRATKP